MIDWISVKDQMPDTVGSYLISFLCHTGKESIDIAYIEDDVFKVWDERYGEDIEIHDVTHWAHITYPSQTVKNWALLFKDKKGISCYMSVECSEPDIPKNAKMLEDCVELKYMDAFIEVKSSHGVL